MITNYILITLRSMMKSKVYIFINILGMAISIAGCITAYYNYNFNATFDNVHAKAGQIYRLNSVRKFQDDFTEYGVTPIALSEVARENVKDFTHMTRYNTGYMDLRVGDENFGNGIGYVDPDFFEMFTFEFLAGSPSAIREKNKLLISDVNAVRLFGSVQEALGKTVTHMLGKGKTQELEIAGVYKLPVINSSFNDEAFGSYKMYLDLEPELNDGHTWYYRTNAFVELTNPSRIRTIEEQLKPFVENNNKVREDFIITEFKLDPLVGMATRDEYEDRPGTWTRDASPKAAVIGCAIMAILVLLIACFNLTNTSIAVSSRRLKEIGLRKVMGSMRIQLILQFIGETMLVCFISLVIGMVVATYLLVPAFNSLWPYMKLETNYFGEPNVILVLIGILLFTSILAGSYPAFYISRFQPSAILKGTVKFGGTNWFTRTLLILQFSISLIGIVASFGFVDNARYQKEVDLGYSKEGAFYTWISSEEEFNVLRNAMMENPDVVSVSGSQHQLFSSAYNDPIKSGTQQIEVDILHVGDNYLSTMGMTLKDGRDFMKDSENDRQESVIVTERVASLFGWDKPIGQEIIWMDTVKLRVVGVIKDVYNNGVWREMTPMMLRYSAPKDYRHFSVSAPASKIVSVNQFMEARWKELFPNTKYNSRYLDEEMVEAANVNNNIVKMFVFLGIVAMMLSVTGLFTMVSLNIIKKMKEIGVRKVLGASIANISGVINFQFAVILFIASALGGVLGVFVSDALMDSIWDFYQMPTVTTVVISATLMILASALTVALKTYNTAKLNPVHVLRDE